MTRLTHLVCPVDLSEFSRHALDLALPLARSRGAALTLLHVVEIAPGAAALQGGGGVAATAAVEVAQRDAAAGDMERLLGEYGDHGVRTDVLVVESAGPVHREILGQARRLGADLLVMGTHGRSGFERMLLGSTTEKVLRRSTIPVLTVPPRADPAAARFDAILCALDFSDCSRTALRHAASLAGGTDARLLAVHVIETMPVMYEPNMAVPFDFARDRPALEIAGREFLHRFVSETLPAAGLPVQELVLWGKPYVEILRAAGEHKVDLVVLGVHGHHVFDRLLFGTTAGHVVRGAACPVLTVRS